MAVLLRVLIKAQFSDRLIDDGISTMWRLQASRLIIWLNRASKKPDWILTIFQLLLCEQVISLGAARKGISLPEAMQQSGHKSIQEAALYYNDSERRSGLAARLIDR